MSEHNSFLLYKDNYDLLLDFDPEELGILFLALYEFACFGIEPNIDDRALKSVYRTMRNSISRNDEKYQAKCKKASISANIRYAKELDISIETLVTAKYHGLTVETMKQTKLKGTELKQYIDEYIRITANASEGIRTNTDNESDSDSDTEIDYELDIESDNGIEKESVTDNAPERDIGSGRDGSEGKPSSYSLALERIFHPELAKSGGALGFDD